MLVGSAIDDSSDFLLPTAFLLSDKLLITGLPKIMGENLQLMPCLMILEAFTGKIEQRNNQLAACVSVTPVQQGVRRVASFTFVEPVVLVARAVMNAITIDQREISNDQRSPGIVDDWF